MGLKLKKSDSIFMDTAPLIYYWENNREYFKKIASVFDAVYDNDVQVIVSLVTYIEVMTYPIKCGNIKLASKYRDYFTNSANMTLYPVNLLVAEKTAVYRAEHGLKTPDAIQLATAETCGADYVITNDAEWKKLADLEIVLVSEL